MTPRHETTDERRLAFRSPLAADRLLGFLASRAIPGVEHVERRRYTRAVRDATGPPVVLELAVPPRGSAISLRVSGDGPASAAVDALARRARHLFDLDADPVAIDSLLGADPLLAPLVAAAPGTRLPGAIDGFEMAIRAIVGQQVSVSGARTTLGRISARFGEALAEPVGPVTHLFPSPERLAQVPRSELGMPGARADAIRTVAAAAASGELDLSGDGGADAGSTLDLLRAIRGVGEWTAAYVAMRALHDGDSFPVGDLGVRRGFAALGLPDDPGSMRRHAERWRPWRAYAVIHLWLGGSRAS